MLHQYFNNSTLRGYKKNEEHNIFCSSSTCFSGFSAIGMGEASEKQGNLRFSFSEPSLVENDVYVELRSEGTDSWVFDAGSPMLPRRIETLTLPFGATIQDINCVASGVQTKVLSQKIRPAPRPMPLSSDVAISSAPEMNPEL